MILMTRRVGFSSAQSDWLESLSEQENQSRFGANASPEPYGFNYILDVCVQGEINPSTGILVNIKEIDRIVKEQIVLSLDRKHINVSADYFQACPVTPETLLTFIADKLESGLPEETKLHSLRLEQTPLRFSYWQSSKGQPEKEQHAMQMTCIYEFAASHRLHSNKLTEEENRALFGKCNYANGHGHNYILEVTVSGPIDSRTGRILDDTALESIVNREVVDRYDHHHFNLDLPEFREVIPSSEMITKIIWDRLKPYIPMPARLHRIVLRETARNFFEYQGEDESN